jgi:hypothetical protein
MNNGSNDWDVSFSHISWFARLLNSHPNVKSVSRHDDLVFDVKRSQQLDNLVVFCCNQYTASLTMIHRALEEFGKLDLIYIGGGWCGYTREAKDFCLQSQIGLYVTDEMSGALWKDEYWDYAKKDRNGNPEYHIHRAA